MKFVFLTILLAVILSLIWDIVLYEGNDRHIKTIFKDRKTILLDIPNWILIGIFSYILPKNFYSIILLLIIFILYEIILIDIKEQLINIKLIIALFIVAIVSLFINNGVTILDSLITGLVLFILLYIVSKATREALGKGDAMIFGILGFVFGYEGMISILILSSAISFVISMIYLIRGFRKKSIAFTPCIYIALLVLIFLNNY